MQRGQTTALDISHPVVDQATPQMGLIHPLRYPGIVFVRYQQRQAKVVQQAFNGPLPGLVLLAHLQQFTGKR